MDSIILWKAEETDKSEAGMWFCMETLLNAGQATLSLCVNPGRMKKIKAAYKSGFLGFR